MGDFTIIPAGEMDFTPRGRKSKADPKLVAALASLDRKSAIRLDALAVKATGDAKQVRKDRARISARVRAAAKAAGVRVRIAWSPAGVPQVELLPEPRG